MPLRNGGNINMFAGYSWAGYKTAAGLITLPRMLDRKLAVSAGGRWIDADKVSYYGLGIDSDDDDKTSYSYEPTRAGVDATFTPVWWLNFGGRWEYLDVNTGPGQLDRSIEEVFDQGSAPGLEEDLTYQVPRLLANIDWRDSPGYSRRGGLYQIAWSRYKEQDDKPFDFDQFDIDLVQYVPLLRENWVLAFRARATIIDTDGGNVVPYFMMPYLGSGESLRGYSNRRFRDQNQLLLTAEYRWTPSHFIDMALFFDAGKVEADRHDLDFDNLKTDYGIGIRFHGPAATALRVDVAHGDEGLSIIFTTGAPF
jgi:outer membrane protein assembly factor BamA